MSRAGGQPKLRIVGEPERSPAELLAEIVPELAKAEATVRQLRGRMLGEVRNLARQRGIAFMREEQVRREFGGD